MLVLGDFMVFLEVVFSIDRFMEFHRVGSFNQVITQVVVPGPGKGRSFRLVGSGLLALPVESGILGHFGFVLEALNLADFGKDSRRVDGTDARDAEQALAVRNGLKDLFDGLLQGFDLFLEGFDHELSLIHI